MGDLVVPPQCQVEEEGGEEGLMRKRLCQSHLETLSQSGLPPQHAGPATLVLHPSTRCKDVSPLRAPQVFRVSAAAAVPLGHPSGSSLTTEVMEAIAALGRAAAAAALRALSAEQERMVPMGQSLLAVPAARALLVLAALAAIPSTSAIQGRDMAAAAAAAVHRVQAQAHSRRRS
jgi:hypothetical protein